MGYYKPKGDVEWWLPGKKKKRPVAYSTIATSDLITLLCNEEGTTWNELLEKINYDDEAKNICKIFIDAGYGDLKMYPRHERDGVSWRKDI